MNSVNNCDNNFDQNLPNLNPLTASGGKSILDIPDHLLLNIFSYAFPAELDRTALVSKRFKELTANDYLWKQFTLKTLYPWSYVIDETVWAKPALQTEGIDTTGGNVLPIGDKALVKKHAGDLRREAKKTENGELVYMLIPKGSSFNKLRQIAQMASSEPEGEDGAFVGLVWRGIVTGLGDIEVEETRIVAISTSVLKGSRGESFVAQEARLGNGFKVTQVLEASMLHIVMRIIFSECLYRKKPTLMRSDQQIGRQHLIVGGVAPHGLCVDNDSRCDHGDVGIGAMRKL